MAAGQDRAGDAIRREWRLAWLAACQTHRYILTCLYADSARNRNDLVWKWTRGREGYDRWAFRRGCNAGCPAEKSIFVKTDKQIDRIGQ